MLKKATPLGIVLLALALILSACRSPAPAETAGPADPNAVFTAAAQTAAARMTEAVAVTPTAPPTEALPAPTTAVPELAVTTPAAPADGAAAATTAAPAAGTPGATTGGTTPIAPAATTPGATTGGTTGGAPKVNHAEFVADVTVPDGTNFGSGESFVKTWSLKNIGTGSWTTDFALAYVSGDQLGDATEVAMPIEVSPGETVDISVNMTAPDEAGHFISYWMLRDPNGNYFGIGNEANAAIYVDINVGGDGGDGGDDQGTPSANAGGSVPIITPARAGSFINTIFLSVDNDFTEACPHVFTFNAQITLSQATTVIFGFDAHSDAKGVKFTELPVQTNATLDNGTHSLGPWTLTIDETTDAWVQLHAFNPENVVSNRVTVNTRCN